MHPEDAKHPERNGRSQAGAESKDVSAVLDLPAGIEYLHLPGACLGSLFEGNEDLARSVRRGHQDLTYGLQLALYEICANIVMHGYGICPPEGDTNGPDPGACRIHVVFSVLQRPVRLAIDLYDTGRSFDITRVPEPDIAEPQARGYGLYLIRQLVDEVVYEAQEGGNHWRLTKFL